MQISKKEESVSFEQLEKKLKEPPFNSKEGKHPLIRLITDPQSKLSAEEAINYGELQGDLLHKDTEVRRITYVAMCLAILREKMAEAELQISKVIRQQKDVLSLRLSSIREIDLPTWQAFCNALQASRVTSFSLTNTNLGLLDQVRWQAFCNALQTSKISSLSLTNTNLRQLDQVRWQAFFSALQVSEITSLNLGMNYLELLGQTKWQDFWKGLQSSKITSLDLKQNDLGKLDQVWWQDFCVALKTSNITSLNLTSNYLGKIDQSLWQAFCDAIHESNITSLELNDLFPNQTQSLVTLMKNNFHLVLQGEFTWPPELIELNNRNRFLQQTLKTAQELIHSKSKPNEINLVQLNNTLTDLETSLSILHDKNTPRNNALREKLHSYLEDLQWKKAEACREQAFIKKDAPSETQDLLNQARQAWLSISPKSKYFAEARYQLFQLVYNNIIQDPKANAHEAFREALPYLVDEENQLINLSKENQKVFDNFLFVAACGKEGGLDREFTPELRLALLQYILLLEIKQNCKQKDDAGKVDTQFFKTERLAGLLDLLKDLQLDPKNLDVNARKNLNDLWVKTYGRLQKMPLSDNNTNVLIEAVNHLAFPTHKLDSKARV